MSVSFEKNDQVFLGQFSFELPNILHMESKKDKKNYFDDEVFVNEFSNLEDALNFKLYSHLCKDVEFADYYDSFITCLYEMVVENFKTNRIRLRTRKSQRRIKLQNFQRIKKNCFAKFHPNYIFYLQV